MISLSEARRLKPEQNAPQHRHGNGDLEEIGKGEEEDLPHVGPRRTAAHHNLKDVRKQGHEENESKEGATNECEGEDLAENVAGEDAHREAFTLV